MKILIIDDEPNILKTMSIGLRSEGYEVTAFSDPEAALRELDANPERLPYSVAFVDLMMHPMDGMTTLRELRRRYSDLPIIIITAHATIETAVEALKLGAFDYLQKPFDQKELLAVVECVSKLQKFRKSKITAGSFITEDPELLSILSTAEKIANSDLTVLIEGETGTGKELIADFIHTKSRRASKPLIKLNCAALSEELIESELFGHAKGSFTSAYKDRIGLVEAANGGTLFLDEIGEMPAPMQAKMLRFLQNREFQRVGENTTRKSDVRIVAATNRNLEEAIDHGNFREDLFYRLSGFRLLLPPLRLRRKDIILLANYFIASAKDIGPAIELSEAAMTDLLAYDWRGNVRELENVMIRALVLAAGERQILPSHLPAHITNRKERVETKNLHSELVSLEEIERRHIAFVLSKIQSLDEAAKILQIDNATLWRKRKKFGL